MAPVLASNGDIKVYLPGDYVNLIVEAPIDTAQITAVMPDRQVISLVREEGGRVWRAVWQVPADMAKGLYSAKLRAVDLEGKIYEGNSVQFQIGQHEMIMLVGYATREARRPAPPLAQQVTISQKAPGSIEVVSRTIYIYREAAGFSKGQKAKLVEMNMLAAKTSLALGDQASAASHFRVVLYIDPANKTAGENLAKIKMQIAQAAREKAERQAQMLYYFAAGGIGAVLLVILLLLLWRMKGKATILIADDEELVRQSLAAILRKGGYKADLAADGEEAIRKVRENNYGLLLLDITLPKVDGYEVLRRIREVNNDLPVIFVSARVSPEKTAESFSKYKLSAFLEKPFTPKAVLSAVAKYIR